MSTVMPQSRVQFQSGLSMVEFLERYGTEAQCEEAVVTARWPQGFVCPSSQGRSSWRLRRTNHPYRPCSGCNDQCSLTVGPALEHTQLPPRICSLAMPLITQSKNGAAALELRRQLGVSCPTAWLLKHKRVPAVHTTGADPKLDGRLEMDDALLGGERSGGKPGRGWENKVPFVVAVQTVGQGRGTRSTASAWRRSPAR